MSGDFPVGAPLPGAPWLRRDGADRLTLDGVDLDNLARTHGTPLYAYSANAILDAAQAYRRALEGRRHLLCYAMKANSTLAILRLLDAAGWGFDIVSGGELARVQAAGIDASKVVFSGVGKTRDEMRAALAAGVRCFNVESEAELHTLSEVAVAMACRAPVSLRVNPDVDAGTHPYISTGLKDNKFGVPHAQARRLYRLAASLPGLRVAGIDCHIGSQITQVAPYVDALDRVLDLVEAIEADGIPIAHVDVGGGLGIRYTDEQPPPAGVLIAALLARLDARGHGHREVQMEPGRSVVGNAGVLLTQVLLTKVADAPDGKNFCVVDAAMNDLMRPAMYQATMGIVPCVPDAARTVRTWDVVGPVCESGDWLGRDRALGVQAGDTLAVLSAGAYGMAMASNYNTRPRAAEVLLRDGVATEIRRRERVEDLFRDERLDG